jgi:uncharacterized membrane-anchored protein YitT (DUF2179 family)
MPKIIDLKKLRGVHPFNFLGLTIAGIINSIGVCLFLYPLNIYDGGLSGTSILIDKLTPAWLSMSVFLLVLNIPFYLIGHKKIGLEFLVYSLYAIAMYSLFSYVINSVLPLDFSNGSPVVGDDKVLGALFGGLLSGIGSGLVMKFGGALDGVEVMSLIFHKKLGVSVGTFVMMYNAILFITAAVIFSSWVLPLYSLIAYFIGLKTIDFIVEGLEKGKAALIITDKSEEVASVISEELKRGITVMDATGYYSGAEKTMLYVVVNRFEIARLKDLVKILDENAFVSIIEVSEIVGASKMYRRKGK